MTAATPGTLTRLERLLIVTAAGQVGEQLLSEPSADGWRRQWPRPALASAHESAHALTAWALGGHIYRVTIRPDGDGPVCIWGERPESELEPGAAKPFVNDDADVLGAMGEEEDIAIAKTRAREILQGSWKKFLTIFDMLLIKGELTGNEIDELLTQ